MDKADKDNEFELALQNLSAENDIEIKYDEPMKKHCTYRIGGPADYFYSVDNVQNLIKVLTLVNKYNIDLTIIGLGSNVLVSDKGIRGMVVSFDSKFNRMGILRTLPKKDEQSSEWLEQNLIPEVPAAEKVMGKEFYVYSESGAALKALSHFAAQNSLTGLEFSCGIPGSVGGAVYMNAGAYGGMTENVCVETYYLDHSLELKMARGSEQDFGYRQSKFHKENGIILGSIYKLKVGEQDKIDELIDELMRRRIASQPLEYPSCGSVFKRPEGHYAGKLIMDSGLKGYRVGGAEISQKHAGFIINIDNASASDVLAVIRHVQATVKANFDVDMETEVRIIGDW